MNQEEQFIGYLKFFGPSVEEGKIDIEKIGNSLIALNKLFKKYTKTDESKKIELKLGGIKKNCTEVNIFFEQIVPVVQPIAKTASILLIAKSIGITELGKQFFGTIGQQLALKIFAKGKSIKKEKDLIEDGKIYVLLKNDLNEERKFLKEVYDSQKEFSTPLRDLIQLENLKEEKLEIGYYKESTAEKVGEIKVEQKDFFITEQEPTFEERFDEDFDESKAVQMKIIGQFVDYYGLAHKYHFSFQARKNQEEVGKQKILCKTDKLNISEIIDFLKPENQKNICISGQATLNKEGKVDKIMIEWINEDENFNPQQNNLFKQ
ncbi:MAG: hypothetical protein A2493_01195 [Candidatus Magasanikbacteria bacterium RIFOXYC12_FULL_33_11]|uniref:Uncharacterized protein n=1 Tax=Candidatus Magasanikbacteria bacterium RIFOXYC12_FULL_33_11 TaxID=1798701 RepID=A0A1F6NS16_9BACT|nr:MAG: hypothetical protein A2493_01195 [Candidatus Magasanikbacteria bacterium RIFOXYC12_FULL_33_11]